MSVVAKILVVINLILAVVFLAATSTFLGAKTNAKKDLAKYKEWALEQIRVKENQKVEADKRAEAAESTVRTLETERKTAIDALTEKERTYADMDLVFQAQKEVLLTQTATMETLRKDYDNLVVRCDELIKQAQDAIKGQEVAVGRANVAVADKERLEDEQIVARQQLADAAKKMAQLSEANKRQALKIETLEKAYGPASDLIGQKALDVVVTGVSTDVNLVMLSLGRDDGVKKGYEFTIYRGDEYIGKVVVDEVSKDHCTAYSVKRVEKTPIRVGDHGTTRF